MLCPCRRSGKKLIHRLKLQQKNGKKTLISFQCKDCDAMQRFLLLVLFMTFHKASAKIERICNSYWMPRLWYNFWNYFRKLSFFFLSENAFFWFFLTDWKLAQCVWWRPLSPYHWLSKLLWLRSAAFAIAVQCAGCQVSRSFLPTSSRLDCVSKAKKTDPITKWTRQEIVYSTFF